MKKFINESWDEYLELLKKVVPQDIQIKFEKNQRKYIRILIVVILTQIFFLASYNIFISNSEQNHKTNKNQTKDIVNG